MSIANNMREDGVAVAPSGYNIKKCSMTRYDGDSEIDITSMVTRINLIESLYSSTVILQLSIKDNANFLEEFPVVGHERIHLILDRIEHDTEVEKRIELKFVVTEYPLFGKDEGNPNVSAYTLNAIGEHAYAGSIQEVSRSFEGPTIDEIKKILGELGPYNIRQIGSGITAAKGVLPRTKPLEACEWFRSRTVDKPESPLYLFQTIDGVMNLAFLSELVKKDRGVHGVYRDTRMFSQNPQSLASYKEQSTRILETISNLKFGRVFQSQAGAFASNMEFVDIANKTFGRKDYGYNIEQNTLTANPPFSSAFLISDKPLNEYYDARSSKVSINSMAFGSSQQNTNVLRRDFEQKNRSFNESLETMTHEIKLFGDYELNPGKIITCKFPRAIDPEEAEKSNEDQPGEDELISGKYLVTGVQHEFKGGEYFIRARIKRDSMGFRI